jgi:Protein of unknown function (DUF3768)
LPSCTRSEYSPAICTSPAAGFEPRSYFCAINSISPCGKHHLGLDYTAVSMTCWSGQLEFVPVVPGITALGQAAVERMVKTTAVYDNFYHANDPHEENDFGAFDADGKRILFKINVRV